MPEVTIHSLTWERVNLSLHGTLQTSGSSGALALWLVNEETEQRVPIPNVVVSQQSFTARMNSMRIDGRYPLSGGRWRVFATVGSSGDEQPVLMSRPFALDAGTLGGLFTVRTGQYWIMPGSDSMSGQFCIDINDNSQPAPKPLHLRSFAQLSRAVRIAVYILLYDVVRLVVPKSGKRILFASDSRPTLSGNLKCIHDRMVERGLDSEYRLMTAFKKEISARRTLHQKLTFPVRLAMADTIIIDDLHPMVSRVRFDQSVRIIQTWHASGSFKTFAYSRMGTVGAPAPFSPWHRNYTYALTSSSYDVPLYAEAFSIAETDVIPTGIPRMDIFLDKSKRQQSEEEVYRLFPSIRGKRVIIFAPTFRGNTLKTAYYDFDRIDLDALYALCCTIDAVVVFKIHPLVPERVTISEAHADRFVDATEHREINDFLLVADVVITDYSSLVFECAALGCPMLFFAYDLHDYVANRGFYTPFEEFVPGKIVMTFDALLDALGTEDYEVEKVADFRQRHFDHLDSNSTDRVIDQLILGQRAT